MDIVFVMCYKMLLLQLQFDSTTISSRMICLWVGFFYVNHAPIQLQTSYDDDESAHPWILSPLVSDRTHIHNPTKQNKGNVTCVTRAFLYQVPLFMRVFFSFPLVYSDAFYYTTRKRSC